MANERFTLKMLREFPFIIREPGSGTRKETERFLFAQGVDIDDLNIVAQMDDSDAIKHAISQGLGISVLSRLAVENYAELGLLRIQQPAGGVLKRNLYIVKRRSGVLSPAASAFVQFAKDFYTV